MTVLKSYGKSDIVSARDIMIVKAGEIKYNEKMQEKR